MNSQNNISSSILDICFNCGEEYKDYGKCLECEYSPYEGLYKSFIHFFEKNKNIICYDNISDIITNDLSRKEYINTFFCGYGQYVKEDIFDKSVPNTWGVELDPLNDTGIVFMEDSFYLIENMDSIYPLIHCKQYHYNKLLDIKFKFEKGIFFNSNYLVLDGNYSLGFYDSELKKEFLIKLINETFKFLNEVKNKQKIIVNEKQTQLNNSKSQLLKELDKDGNGLVDVIEADDFYLLLKRHQKHITELGRNDNKNYIQQFIQLKNYLVDERKNIQHLFNLLNDVQNQELLDEYVNILNNNIHSYKVLLIHSINMICVLIEDDLLAFYDIYERLDKLNVFNSNFQNQMLSRLSNIETRLDDVIYSIQDMSLEIVSSLDMLTDEIQQSSNMLSKNLESIESSIDVNTFITGIGVYQMYKTNKNLN